MIENMEIVVSLVLLVTELTFGNAINNILNRKDPCINLCENTSTDFSNSMYIKSCCQRGCRFFNLVDLSYRWELDRLNGTRSACEASCTEAYINLNDRYVCNTGCNFMAKQRVSELLPLFTVAICMEESIDILPMPPDIPENDILTDPGLRKELLPRWWDADGFKLPQTHIKTIPIDARTVDYTLSSDYSGETKQLVSTSKSESFQRERKQTKNISVFWGLCFMFGQFYVFFFPIIVSAMSLYFAKKIDISYRNRLYKNNFSKNNISKDIILFMPSEMVMYKVPPPKRHNESSNRSI